MTGLKLLADRVDAKMMSRATAGHAASIGISGAMSFATAEWLTHLGGWQIAFLVASLSAVCAWLIIAVVVPAQARKPAQGIRRRGLYDFRPVLKNRSAMAYALAYSVHTLEMSALRGWGVAFLAYVAVSTGNKDAAISPAVVVTLRSALSGPSPVCSAMRWPSVWDGAGSCNRPCSLPVILGGTIGFLGTLSYTIAAALMLVYGLMIWLDSSSSDSRRGRHCRALAARGDARSPFDARLRGRLRWATHDGLDARSQRRHVDVRLGHLVCRVAAADARSP